MRKRKIFIIAFVFITSLTIIYSCTIGGGDDDSTDSDDDSDDDSKCDIGCYKDYLEGAIDCLHEYVDCLEAGNEMYICVQNIMACDESLQSDAKTCTYKCEDSCFGAFIKCIDECEEEDEDNYNECRQQCSDQFCDCAKWLDCDCQYTCAKNSSDCINSAYQANDYEAMHQCVDDYKTCWLGCISD